MNGMMARWPSRLLEYLGRAVLCRTLRFPDSHDLASFMIVSQTLCFSLAVYHYPALSRFRYTPLIGRVRSNRRFSHDFYALRLGDRRVAGLSLAHRRACHEFLLAKNCWR